MGSGKSPEEAVTLSAEALGPASSDAKTPADGAKPADGAPQSASGATKPAAADKKPAKKRSTPKRQGELTEKELYSFIGGVILVAIILALVVVKPPASEFAQKVFSVVLSLGSGLVAAIMLGSLDIEYKVLNVVVRAGGALAVLALVLVLLLREGFGPEPVEDGERLYPTATPSVVIATATVEGGVTPQATPVDEVRLPQVRSFTVNPMTIREGACATLTWSVEGVASGVSITDLGSVGNSGSREVCPDRDTTYELIAQGSGEVAARATVFVRVEPEPKIVYFRSNASTVREGSCATLEWQVEGESTKVTFDPDLARLPGSSQTEVCPSETETYRMTLTWQDGTASESVTVNVDPKPTALLEMSSKADWFSGTLATVAYPEFPITLNYSETHGRCEAWNMTGTPIELGCVNTRTLPLDSAGTRLAIVMDLSKKNQRDGTMFGVYPPLLIPDAAEFGASVGFAQGSYGGRVWVRVFARREDGTEESVVSRQIDYGDGLIVIEGSLERFRGEPIAVLYQNMGNRYIST